MVKNGLGRVLMLVCLLGFMTGCRTEVAVKDETIEKPISSKEAKPPVPVNEKKSKKEPAPVVKEALTPRPPEVLSETSQPQEEFASAQRAIERLSKSKHDPNLEPALQKLAEAEKALEKKEFARVKKLCQEVEDLVFKEMVRAVKPSPPRVVSKAVVPETPVAEDEKKKFSELSKASRNQMILENYRRVIEKLREKEVEVPPEAVAKLAEAEKALEMKKRKQVKKLVREIGTLLSPWMGRAKLTDSLQDEPPPAGEEPAEKPPLKQ